MDLPNEIWEIIAGYTDYVSYFNLRFVNKQISYVIKPILYPKLKEYVISKNRYLNYAVVLPIVKFDFFVWLIKKESEFMRFLILEKSCTEGRLDLVKYLVENGQPITTQALYNACIGGHILIVDYFKRKGFPVTEIVNLTVEHNYRCFNIIQEYKQLQN